MTQETVGVAETVVQESEVPKGSLANIGRVEVLKDGVPDSIRKAATDPLTRSKEHIATIDEDSMIKAKAVKKARGGIPSGILAS